MRKQGASGTFADCYNHVEEYLLVVSLIINVILVFMQVIMRTVFRNSLTWSEELSRYIYIWQIWLGASIALKHRQHIRVTMLLELFKKNNAVKNFITLLADLVWFLFCVYMIFNGVSLLQSMAGRNAVSSGLHLPLVCVYLVFPLASFLVSLRLSALLFEDIRRLTGKGAEEI